MSSSYHTDPEISIPILALLIPRNFCPDEGKTLSFSSTAVTEMFINPHLNM